MAGREELINQLAAKMGAGDFAQTKYTESRYDAQTGTLYCDGIMITKPVIEKAEQYFKNLKSKCSYIEINDAFLGNQDLLREYLKLKLNELP